MKAMSEATASALSALLPILSSAAAATGNPQSSSSAVTLAAISAHSKCVDISLKSDRRLVGPGPQESLQPEPKVLGGREIVDQRGKTRLVGPFYCSVCRKQFPHKSLTEIHLQCHMEKRWARWILSIRFSFLIQNWCVFVLSLSLSKTYLSS